MGAVAMTEKSIDSGRIHLLLSHGWVADSSMFGDLVRQIDTSKYEVIQHDHAGYGARSNEPCKTLSEQADELIRMASDHGWRKFAILGHSMGAIVAQELAVRVPELISGVILLCPVLADGHHLTESQMADKRQMALDPNSRRANVIANAADQTTGRRVADLSLESASGDAMTAVLPSWAKAEDRSKELSATSLPALLITGRQDPAVDKKRISSVKDHWFDGRLTHQVVETGHYPMMQRPSETWQLCANFLSECQ